MKKVILGGLMMLSGILATAILIAAAMSQDWIINGERSLTWNLSQYGLMPVLYIFIVLGIVGLLIGCWGIFEKDKPS